MEGNSEIERETEKILKVLENQIEKNEAIFDISVFPILEEWMQARVSDKPLIIYIPDTIEKLVIEAHKNPHYYYILGKLFSRWTRKKIDINSIEKILMEKEIGNIKIKTITKDLIDVEIYNFCYEKFSAEDLITEFSPEFNVLGDIIGKILGAAHKLRVPIVMMNRRLVSEIKHVVPVFDTANAYQDKKASFFERYIPQLKRTRGVRWVLGITIGTLVSPIGIILALLDP